jgi:hypothetical protein
MVRKKIAGLVRRLKKTALPSLKPGREEQIPVRKPESFWKPVK